MARIFISYRRDDTRIFSARINDRLVREFGKNNVFFDVDRNIPAGSTWKQVLQTSLEASDVLLVIIGDKWEAIINERGEDSDWVRFEVEHGLNRDDMLVIPVLVDNTSIPSRLPQSIQALTDRQTHRVRHDPDFNSDMRDLHVRIRGWQGRRRNRMPYVIGFTVFLLIAVIAFFSVQNLLSGTTQETPDAPTEIVENPTTESPADTLEPSETYTPSVTPEIATLVAQLDGTATQEQATVFVEETFSARASQYAQGTQDSADQTATATRWTDTPTPDVTASINAYRTQQAATATQAWIDSWTDTPTSTWTPSPTLTPSNTPPATLPPFEAAIERAWNFAGTLNSHWERFIHTFDDGHEMALVPVGCFVMGTTNEQTALITQADTSYTDEQPSDLLCIEEPYWIDVNEVSNAQYGSIAETSTCLNVSSEPNQPRNCINWFDAQEYCQSRGATLASELQWEYAARGIENWLYPWGNEYIAENVIGKDDPTYGSVSSAPVGIRPEGASWVGAKDLAGNVWEWVYSQYKSYPYNATDGREEDTGDSIDVPRVIRGGSFGGTTDYLRTASRGSWRPDVTKEFIGFRCVRSL